MKNPYAIPYAITVGKLLHRGKRKQQIAHPIIPLVHKPVAVTLELSMIKPGMSLPMVFVTPIRYKISIPGIVEH